MNLDGQPASPEVLRRMNATLVHRGPDDHGEHLDGPVALGHRRLSILDLARGHQPMSLGETLWVVYNGEIYNHRHIRADLRQPSDTFRTTSDTETLLVAYRQWGEESLRRLRGMFAFAIYDAAAGSIFLARDRLGVKPLYIYESPQLFAFASEIKALLAHPAILPIVNEDALHVQLALKYTLDDQTLFRGIKKLLPGHWMHVTPKRRVVRQYWDIPFAPKARYASMREAAAVFKEEFGGAVQARLLSDVPLGVFLSGGIDSSVIAAAMSKMVEEPIQAFSVAFAANGYSELEYSRAVARHIGAQVREVVVSPEQWLDAWPSMVYHEDEPLAHPSSIPLYFVSKLASQDVKVVLTGEGADELLAGYERYYQTLANLRLGKMIPTPLRNLTRWLIDALPDGSVAKRKAVRTSLYLPSDLDSLFLDNYAAFPRGSLVHALQPRYQTAMIDKVYGDFHRLMETSDAEELLDKILYADLKTYLVELLMKQDQMSMAASVESRVPFLDHVLVEFICRLPVEYKLKGFKTKRILRYALGDTVPRSIVTRPKQGFPTPIQQWFRTRFYSRLQQLLLGPGCMLHDYVRPEYIGAVLERHRRGEWDMQQQIWTLANLEIWLRVFIAGHSPQEVFSEAQAKQTELACESSG
jgi:asparagine synthase (glutamine-hydrolysing)